MILIHLIVSLSTAPQLIHCLTKGVLALFPSLCSDWLPLTKRRMTWQVGENMEYNKTFSLNNDVMLVIFQNWTHSYPVYYHTAGQLSTDFYLKVFTLLLYVMFSIGVSEERRLVSLCTAPLYMVEMTASWLEKVSSKVHHTWNREPRWWIPNSDFLFL